MGSSGSSPSIIRVPPQPPAGDGGGSMPVSGYLYMWDAWVETPVDFDPTRPIGWTRPHQHKQAKKGKSGRAVRSVADGRRRSRRREEQRALHDGFRFDMGPQKGLQVLNSLPDNPALTTSCRERALGVGWLDRIRSIGPPGAVEILQHACVSCCRSSLTRLRLDVEPFWTTHTQALHTLPSAKASPPRRPSWHAEDPCGSPAVAHSFSSSWSCCSGPRPSSSRPRSRATSGPPRPGCKRPRPPPPPRCCSNSRPPFRAYPFPWSSWTGSPSPTLHHRRRRRPAPPRAAAARRSSRRWCGRGPLRASRRACSWPAGSTPSRTTLPSSLRVSGMDMRACMCVCTGSRAS